MAAEVAILRHRRLLPSVAALLGTVLLLTAACQDDRLVDPGGEDRNRPPTVTTGGPYAPVEGSVIKLTADGVDPDGDSLSYAWSLGGGRKRTGRVVDWIYYDNGAYAPTVIVTDPDGASDTAVATVMVSNAAPEISQLATPLTPVAMNTPASFWISAQDPGLGDSLKTTIDWGDHVTTQQTDFYSTTHAYALPGEYFVTVTARDKDGAIGIRKATNAVVVYDPNVSEPDAQLEGYEVIDLGTLGGSNTEPRALNDNGQVVGHSSASDGGQRAFLWEDGVMRDLNFAGESPVAAAITNSGIIAGSAGRYSDKVFVWHDGAVTELNAGAEDPRVVALTDTEILTNTGDTEHGPSTQLWVNGVKRGLGGAALSAAMNKRGQIVGMIAIGEHRGNKIFHPFLWENGVVRDLGLLGDYPCSSSEDNRTCGEAFASDINNSGAVIGHGVDSLSRRSTAVLWVNGSIRDLGFESPIAINDAGEIAGHEEDRLGGQAVLWRSGTLTKLGTLGGGPVTVVGMNDQTMITGSGWTKTGRLHVFVWRPGQVGLTDLGVGWPGADQAKAVAINSRGDIIGLSWKCNATSFPPGRCEPENTRGILWRVK